jgi:iron complex transport system substrate-binding protein
MRFSLVVTSGLRYPSRETVRMEEVMNVGPKRIVCLTEEPTEILCALGERDRIVGISAYTVRPPDIKDDVPVVSAFLDGSVHKIKALEPDLVIGFSDIQAQLAAKLIKAHLPVLIFNQRSLDEIMEVIGHIGRMVGAVRKTEILLEGYRQNLARARVAAKSLPARPKVYFEEWDDPMISGIEWVSELIQTAGGDDIFAELAVEKGAAGRTVTGDQVIAANPDIIIGSWCGKPVDIQAIRDRPGFDQITAVREDRIYEMDPSIILQPGPAALTDGLFELSRLISVGSSEGA